MIKMQNLNIILFLCFTVPLSMAVFVCGKKSKRVLLFFFFGTVMCLFCGDVASLLLKFSSIDLITYSKFIAPLTEEIFKAIPIIIFACFFKPEKRALLECSLLLGVGFGMLENAYVIALNSANIVLGDVLGRAFGSGMMHGVCTFAVGYGLTFFASEKRFRRFFALGLGVLAVCYHSLYNVLVLSRYAVVGFVMPILLFVPIVLLTRKAADNDENS